MVDITREVIEKAKIYLEREKATTTCGKHNPYCLTNEELELLIKIIEQYKRADLIERNIAYEMIYEDLNWGEHFERTKGKTDAALIVNMQVPKFEPKLEV